MVKKMVFYSSKIHWAEMCDAGAVLRHNPFHQPSLLDIRRFNVVSARYKRKKYILPLALQSNLWRDFFSENSKNLKESTAFSLFLVC